MAVPHPFPVRLVAARSLTPLVRELTFERSSGEPFVFEPGQWVNLVLPIAPGPAIASGPDAAAATAGTGTATELRRAYSIASAPEGTSRFDIALTRVEGGPGSTYLHGLAPGAELHAIGPQGFFTRKASATTPSLFIATGTGLTPMRSMIRAAVVAGGDSPLWVLLGVRREEDVLYRDEFSTLAQQYPRVRFETTLSQADDTWTGRRGYVQLHLPELWRALVARSAEQGLAVPHAYICGLQRMVGGVRDVLKKDLGLPREQVHSERYD